MPLYPARSLCGWLSVSSRESKVGLLKGMLGSPSKTDDGGEGGVEKWEMKYCILSERCLTMHQSPFRLNESLLTVTSDLVESYSENIKRSEASRRTSSVASPISSRSPDKSDPTTTTRLSSNNSTTNTVKEMQIFIVGKKVPIKMRIPQGSGGFNTKVEEGMWTFKMSKAFGAK